MKIESLKDFKALVKACRSLGVDAMEIGEIKFNLGPLPKAAKDLSNGVDKTAFPEASIQVPQFNGPMEEPESPATDELTPDQIMFYSAQGHNELEQ